MAETHKCTACGAELTSNFPAGLCASCLSALRSEAAALDNTIKLSFPLTEKAGDKIGPYKLLEQIGEGGCGVVYVAEQQEPVHRRVALKVIKLGMDTRQVVARFEAERQALAMMDHPNIAKVLDAGATEAGRPYFVMELVKGVRITDYCDRSNLSTSERLGLFMQVCQAIQHAHQKGIIHRDIKPSNILVTLHDGVPVPKVIDFGIAKATTGQRLTDKTLYTAIEQFIGTPAYMSPEQAELSGLDIDTRSDIYALGVLLYELLTGKTPFDAKRMVESGLDEIRRIIREEEPPRPSTRISTLDADEQTTLAKRRHSEHAPNWLGIMIRGDLDWIVMKCLEKDRTRRYETASGLVMDIQRYLDNETVMARPPSSLYRLEKLVRRNKLAFAATSAVAGALIVGLGLSTWLFFKEKDARYKEVEARRRAVAAEQAQSKLREQAQAESAKSRQVSAFLKEMLNGVGPSVALGRDTTMLREILDKTAERVGEDLNEQPDIGADMRTTIGEVYFALGQYAKAEAMHREAVNVRRKLDGNANLLDLARSLDDLGVALEIQTKEPEAISVHREALAIRRKLLGNEHPDVARSLSHLGDALDASYKLDEAEVTVREAVAMQRKLLGNENLDLAQSLTILANILKRNGKSAEGETTSREALAIKRKLLGNNHPEVASSLQSLAHILRAEGKFSEAEDLYREALDLRRKLLGYQHPLVGQSVGNLGMTLKLDKKFAEAATVYRTAAEQGNPDAQVYLGLMYAKGEGLDRDPVAAFGWFHKAAEQGIAYGEDRLALMYFTGDGVTKDMAEAVKWYRRAAEQGYASAQGRLGSMYARGVGVTKDSVEAVNWLRKSADQGDILSQIALARMYQIGEGTDQDSAEAAKWRRKAIEHDDAQAMNNSARFLATCDVAELRDGPAAVSLAEKAVATTSRKVPGFLDTLAAAYAETGQFAKAIRTEREAIGLQQKEKDKKDLASRLKLYESNAPYREP